MRELLDFGAQVQVADPLADPAEALHECGITLTPFDRLKPAAAVVAAVAHRDYRALSPQDFTSLSLRPTVVIDVKACYDRAAMSAAGIRLWRL